MKSLLSLSCKEFSERDEHNKAYSYSKLAKLYREGPKSLISKEKEESDSLRFGSLVDCLLTTPEDFKRDFVVSNFTRPSTTVCKIVDLIWECSDQQSNDIQKVDHDLIDSILVQENYYANYNPDSRRNMIVKVGKDYFSLLFLCKDKILISQAEFNLATKCVDTLKTHPYTAKYFTSDPFDTSIEQFDQVKFEGEFNGIAIRGIFDKVIINHINKTIQPIDLKTTGKSEECFEESVIKWNYDIQAAMYYYMLYQAICKDEYFKSFRILPFKFIVINKFSLSPIAWTFKNEQYEQLISKNPSRDWRELLCQANWHDKTQEYGYSEKTIKANGERVIDLSKLL